MSQRHSSPKPPLKDRVPKDYRPAGFFGLRTPLLPFDELRTWAQDLKLPTVSADDPKAFAEAVAGDLKTLQQRLRSVIERPEIREAIFVASPSLDEAVERWLADSSYDRAMDVALPLARYYQRMSARSTPFGLFAGCSVGTLGEVSRLEVAPPAGCVRHTRLDNNYLVALCEALGSFPDVRRAMDYHPNTSLYRAAGQIRYVTAQFVGTARNYSLCALTPSDPLEAVLERARTGASYKQLVGALVECDDEVTSSEAEEFLDELIDSQVLVSALVPPLTGREPIHHLIDLGARHPSLAGAGEILRAVRDDLAALDREALGVPAERYRSAAARLESLPVPVELSQLFQVDLTRPATATLSAQVIAELERGIELGRRLSPAHDGLRDFRKAFVERYGEREVAFTEALDEDSGIVFGGGHGAETPLLNGLAVGRDRDPAGGHETGASKFDLWALRKLFEFEKGEKRDELILTEADVEQIAAETPARFPDSFAVSAALVASSTEALEQGQFLVRFDQADGPPGARLLGRFCHLDPTLETYVRRHLQEEAACQPGAVFAEITHLPEGRLGNVICRPVLRDHEIAFMARSGAPADKVISIDDLLISVVDGRLVLRSKRLGQEIVPRLTNAHGVINPANLAAYRFLCALQNPSGWSWNWGLAEQVSRRLPRVRYGRLILARGRWALDTAVLETFKKGTLTENVSALVAWRAKVGAPRFLAWHDGEYELPIDFHNALSMEAFARVVRNRPNCWLWELDDIEALLSRGPDGKILHQMVIPFIRAGAPNAPRAITSLKPASETRFFLPGGEWLYAKIYVGLGTLDRVLRELVDPLVRERVRAGECDQWFFIRYGDPDWHLRLRLHGRAEALGGTALPRLNELARSLLAEGIIQKIVLDTYDRELERYGGDVGIGLAEKLFHVDSDSVLEIIGLLDGDEDLRWRVALLSVDRLVDDLGFDDHGKQSVLAELRDGFGREFNADRTGLRHQLGAHFRKLRASLERDLERPDDTESELRPYVAILKRRSERMKPITTALREAERKGELSHSMRYLSGSFLHMHVNRLVIDSGRAHELVLYDYLSRLYEGKVARSRRQLSSKRESR